MPLRDVRGAFLLEEPVSPRWEELPLPYDRSLRALVPGQGRELWALIGSAAQLPSVRGLVTWLRRRVAGRRGPDRPRPGGHGGTVPLLGGRHAVPHPASGHVLAWRPDCGWCSEAAFARSVDALAILHDGTVAVGGERLLALRATDGAWAEHAAPERLVRVWGAGADCVYALGERTHRERLRGLPMSSAPVVEQCLLYFDGRAWAEIDLTDIPGFFADGACDASGYGWIVGTYATHSCMARGKGTVWESDGCGSFYLHRVHVDRGGRAYALGGDGLWRLQDGLWRGVESFGNDIGWPLALANVGGLPWVLWSRHLGEWMGDAPPAPGVSLFMADFWVTLLTPGGALEERRSLECAITPRGEVCLGAGARVWRSPPLQEVVPQVWPPRRLTPAEDPQLASSDPLVPCWTAMQGSKALKQWAWLGSGLLGVVVRDHSSALVRWREVSRPPESVGEFDFPVAAVAPAPGGRHAVIVPQVISEEGFLRGARRVVFVDLDTSAASEVPLPAGCECHEVLTSIAWSPDGARFLVQPKRPPSQKHDDVLVFRADNLTLEHTVALPDGAWFHEWHLEGLVVLFDILLPGPFSAVPAAWVDPVTGEATKGRHRLDVSPSGRYRVTIEFDGIKVTDVPGGTVRRFEPSRDGVLDVFSGGLGRARWVGDRLELPARSLGPVHLDLATLRLHYALPVRREFDAEPQWSPDGTLVLRREWDAAGPVSGVQGWSWSWGAVEVIASA